MRKHVGSALGSALLGVLVAAALAGCTKAASNAAEGGAVSSGAASTAASAATTAMSVVDQLGGMGKVVELADAFGANLSKNPVIGKFLDAAGIAQTKMGLVNEIAKASGMAPPHAGADLMGALSGKGFDAEGISALTSALGDAANQVNFNDAQKAAVMGVVTPLTNQLAGK